MTAGQETREPVGACVRDPRVSRDEIKQSLRLWRAAGDVNLAEVGSLEDMRLAQRFCACMRVDRFHAVTAEELWRRGARSSTKTKRRLTRMSAAQPPKPSSERSERRGV